MSVKDDIMLVINHGIKSGYRLKSLDRDPSDPHGLKFVLGDDHHSFSYYLYDPGITDAMIEEIRAQFIRTSRRPVAMKVRDYLNKKEDK